MNEAIHRLIGAGAAVFVFALVIHFGYALCHDHMMSLLAGILAGWFAWKSCQEKLDETHERMDHPELKLYPLNRVEVMGTVKDALTSMSIGDRWWHSKEINIDRGLMIYEMLWQDEPGNKKKVSDRKQVVLVAQVRQESLGNCLELNYTVHSQCNRNTANELITYTTQTIDRELSHLVTSKLGDRAAAR